MKKPYLEWGRIERGMPVANAVLREFKETETRPMDVQILVAAYNTPIYEGRAFVVYRDKRDGKIYEVNASHCSCNGLEGQWRPEEVVVEELIERPQYLRYEDESEAYRKEANERIRVALLDRL